MARRAFPGLSQPAWAGCGSQGGEERGPAGPGKRPCGPLSANAAMFSGVSRLRRGPSRISLPVGRFPAGLFSHFCPESPAGLFFSPRAAPPGRVQRGKGCTGASCGRPGHVPGRFLPSLPPGRCLLPGFHRAGRAGPCSPSGPERPVEPFSALEWPPRGVPGGKACTGASCGRPERLPPSAGPLFAPSPLALDFFAPSI